MKMDVMIARCRPRIPLALAAGSAALGVLSLSACGSGSSDDPGDDTAEGTLAVAASFYPMEFLAERIGGEHVSVTALTAPGTEPHDAELSPRQTAELTEADVIVYLEGLQPAVDNAVAQSGVAHVAEATSFTTLDAHGTSEDHGDEGHEGGEHEDTHADEGHAAAAAEGDDHGHDHGAEDPHIWLDPVKFAEVAEGVGSVLAKADPDHATDYERNTQRLVDDLATLDEEYAEGLADIKTDTFITNHAAFGYLAARYGLHEEAIAGLDPESEPSAARMRELHDIATENNVTTVFFETLASDETARTLADDLGLETDVLDPVEGITDASAATDYLAVMRANLAALQQALGAA